MLFIKNNFFTRVPTRSIYYESFPDSATDEEGVRYLENSL
jgi:hypothetical protein